MGDTGLVVTSKYSKTTRNCSHSWKNIIDYQTCVVLLILHPKLILQLIRTLHHSVPQVSQLSFTIVSNGLILTLIYPCLKNISVWNPGALKGKFWGYYFTGFTGFTFTSLYPQINLRVREYAIGDVQFC